MTTFPLAKTSFVSVLTSTSSANSLRFLYWISTLPEAKMRSFSLFQVRARTVMGNSCPEAAAGDA
jgi:hypothetical protein